MSLKRWIDILVNNAGVMTEIPLLHMTLEDWRQTLDINLTGYFLCLREVAKHMAARRTGSIVNVASQLAYAEASGSLTTAPQRQAFSD